MGKSRVWGLAPLAPDVAGEHHDTFRRERCEVAMIVHPSPLPDVELPEGALTAYVLRLADELSDTPALIDGPSGRAITYSQLRDRIHSLAGGLAARGFGPGSVLGIMAPNVPEYAVAFHGAAVAGGTITTINPTYTADEIRSGVDELTAAPSANPITGEIVDTPERATREQLSELRALWRQSADLGRPAPVKHLTLDLETLAPEQIAKLADQARGWIAQAQRQAAPIEAEPTAVAV